MHGKALKVEVMMKAQVRKLRFFEVCIQGSHTRILYDLGVSKNRGFYHRIIHFDRVFHYKPSILGGFPWFPPIFGNTHLLYLIYN